MFTFTSTSYWCFGLAQNGVESNRLIPYLGPVFFFGLILVAQAVYYCLLYLCSNYFIDRDYVVTSKLVAQHKNKMKSNLFYGPILVFGVESYLCWAIGVQLSISKLMFVTYGDWIDSLLTIAAFMPVFLLPFIVFCFLRNNRSKFGDEKFAAKFESLWDGLLTEKESQQISSSILPAWNLLRRLLFSIIIVQLQFQTIWF